MAAALQHADELNVSIFLQFSYCYHTNLQHLALNTQADAVQADFAPAVEQAAAAAAQAAEAAAPVADKVKEAVAPAAEQAAAVASSAAAAATTAAVVAVAEAAAGSAAAADGKIPVLGQVVEGAAEQAVQVHRDVNVASLTRGFLFALLFGCLCVSCRP
jgi:hypothetical protein